MNPRAQAPLLLVLYGLVGCPPREQTPQRLPTPVRVRVVERQAEAGGARYSGSIEPKTRVEVAFKVGGYLESIAEATGPEGQRHPIQEGDWIKKGTVLLQVRKSDYLQKVSVAKAALAEAAAGQRLAQADFDRSRQLAASQAIARAQVDSVAARNESATAQLQAASARVAEAELALKDCNLIAPIDGVVLKRRVEVGTLVSPGTVGLSLADTRSVQVVFGAPDALVEKLRIGSPLLITIEAIPGEITGSVSRIAPSADQKGRLYDVESTIDNAKGALRVGMIASLKVPAGALAQDALVLPLTAVVRPAKDPRGFAAYVVTDQGGKAVARLREVQLGDVLGNTIFVRGGLQVGERVVSMGATLLRDGDPVHVIP